jgi:hypothetical protein
MPSDESMSCAHRALNEFSCHFNSQIANELAAGALICCLSNECIPLELRLLVMATLSLGDWDAVGGAFSEIGS